MSDEIILVHMGSIFATFYQSKLKKQYQQYVNKTSYCQMF